MLKKTVDNKAIYIGSDHAGFRLKKVVIEYLKDAGYEVEDLGKKKYEQTDDYPDYAFRVARKVSQTNSKGILLCGSSHGMCIVANKVRGIRAVAVATVRDARKTRQHNDANVLCLSGWHVSEKKAKKIIGVWLITSFSNAPRHRRRVNKIKRIEGG